MLSFLKKTPRLGLFIALMGIPALIIYAAYTKTGDDQLEIAKVIRHEMYTLLSFLTAGILANLIQHAWPTISKIWARFPRSVWWGRSVMLIALVVLPFMPSRDGINGEPTMSQMMAGLAILGLFLFLGLAINFLQFPEDYKKMIKEMFSVE